MRSVFLDSWDVHAAVQKADTTVKWEHVQPILT